MPGRFAKPLDQCLPEVRDAYLKAFANPGEVQIVRDTASPAVANWLHVKLKQARAGFQVFLPSEHEYHRAAVNELLRIEKPKRADNPELRTVTLLYKGKILRPSDLAAQAFDEWKKGLRSTPF